MLYWTVCSAYFNTFLLGCQMFCSTSGAMLLIVGVASIVRRAFFNQTGVPSVGRRCCPFEGAVARYLNQNDISSEVLNAVEMMSNDTWGYLTSWTVIRRTDLRILLFVKFTIYALVQSGLESVWVSATLCFSPLSRLFLEILHQLLEFVLHCVWNEKYVGCNYVWASGVQIDTRWQSFQRNQKMNRFCEFSFTEGHRG